MLKNQLTTKQAKLLNRIIIALILFAFFFIFTRVFDFKTAFNQPIDWLLPCLIWFGIYLFIGYDVIEKAVLNLINGQFLDEHFLMLIASIGAFTLGIVNCVSGKPAEGFDEAVAVILFYQIGQFFESFATHKSRKSISELLDIRPDYAHVLRDGEVVTILPDEVEIGEQIIIYPGEKIPLDCTVTEGTSTIDNKSLTGESLPVDVEINDKLLSGSVNLTSQLLCKVDKVFYESTVSKILDLVENASDKKSKAENFIEKFAKFYTPSVLIFSLLTAIIPSLITKDWQTWLYRALSFLVVSCPCALVISVPMTFFVALGKASRSRILIKGSNYLELLAKSNVFIFDKTGTITQGKFTVCEVMPSENKDHILKIASIAEKNCSHPIARSIVEAYGNPIDEDYQLTTFSGFGVQAVKGDNVILCGKETLLKQHGISVPTFEQNGVYVAENGVFIGFIVIKDTIKSGVNEVIATLNAQNCKTVMLTGDGYEVAKNVASECGITDFKANLLPQDKVFETEKIIADKQPGDVVCFVGDGINDAPVLVRSDIGISMGAIGSDAAIEASDLVLMKDDLHDILLAKKLAKKTMSIVKQNVIFSISIKVLILILSFFGITNMWFSIFGDVGVAIMAISNALRVNK